ncbi:pectinesterase [Rhodamnia argentea]|uniref:Pectinesterase n=1 Tax=Rhodamnia argentea TaxID=178133 RepID=A0A8B8P784_9MYRT|nr:pectinesterase [Rhodamnia argentea]
MGTMRGGWTVLWVVACMLVHGGASMSRAGAPVHGQEHSRHVQEQCGFTRYPALCVRTLARSGSVDLLSALVNKTILETKLPSSYFAQIASLFQTQEAQHAKAVTDLCEDTMALSLKRLEKSLEALKEPAKNKGDVQTWLSAAMTLQESCKDSARGLRPHDLSSDLATSLSRKMDYLAQLTSNALALVNQINRRQKPAKTDGNRNPGEMRGFPSWMSKRDRRLLEGAAAVEANAVVAKDGTGNYRTVSEAIQAASGGRFVIYVKAGVYKEKIHANKDGITLIGDGKYSTIITGDDSAAGGASLTGSSTFTITGDGFIARDIGFQNTAGPQGDQAVALTVASDRSAFYRCSIAGYQDTLYAHVLRQFYRECDIYGTVDFIFGNAAAVFQNCELVVRKPGNKAFTVILANGRSDPGQNTGFSVQGCRITSGAGSGSTYLGRPWKYYSRAVVMQSTIDGGVAPQGWVQWPGYGSSVLRTLYFAEYANQGPGAGISERVNWPGFHVIGAQEAMKFTVQSLISGNSWLPSTGVAFTSGL